MGRVTLSSTMLTFHCLFCLCFLLAYSALSLNSPTQPNYLMLPLQSKREFQGKCSCPILSHTRDKSSNDAEKRLKNKLEELMTLKTVPDTPDTLFFPGGIAGDFKFRPQDAGWVRLMHQ